MDPVELAEAAAYDAATEYELYQATSDPTHLNQAVRIGTLAVLTIPEGHHLLPEFLSNLSVFRQGQYQYSAQAPFAEEAVRVAQQAVDLVRDDDPAKAGLLDTLSNALELHFTSTSDRRILERSIEEARRAVSYDIDDAVMRGVLLNGLSNKITLLYKYTNRLEDLEDAIQAARDIVAITPRDHPNRPSYLTNLASKLHIRHERTEGEEDLEEAITTAQEAADTTPPEHGLKLAGRLNNLGLLLIGRYKQSRNAEALQEAVQNLQKAVDLTPEGHADRAGWLDSLGIGLKYLYQQTNIADHLEDAVRATRNGLDLTPLNHSKRIDRMVNVASVLELRYQENPSEGDLNMALQTARDVSSLASVNNQKRATYSILLATLAIKMCKLSNDVTYVQEAILATADAIDLMSEGDPELLNCWKQVAICYRHQYTLTGEKQLLDKVIEARTMVVGFCEVGSAEWATSLGELGESQASRYRELWDPQDLTVAIQKTQNAVNTISVDHPERASLLDSLGRMLGDRWAKSGNAEDLEKAIAFTREAILLAPDAGPDRARYLCNLGAMLEIEYTRKGNVQVLHESIQLAQESVAIMPTNDPESASGLINLANSLQRLFEYTGEVHYIDEAVRMARDAVHLSPDNHLNLSGRLNNLGSKYGRRYLRLLDMKDLEAAIENGRRAVDSTLNDDPRHSSYVNNLVNRLEERYRRLKSPRDLNEAIQLAQCVVEGAPDTDPAKANCRSNLGVLLDRKYDEEHKPQDIERAVELARGAVDSTPKDHPDQSAFLIRLANSLVKIAGQTRDERSLNEAIKCYLEAAEQPLGLALTRVTALRAALLLLTVRGDWSQAVVVAETAVKLIPQICSRYATREDQQHAVTQTSGLAADACSVLLKVGNVEKAVELLELGRGLIIGYTIDDLDDLSRLQSIDDSLAQRYRTLKIQASMPIDGWDSVNRERLLKERREAVYAIDACIHDIRQTVPGQERFLLGPAIEEIKSHAVEGPIVIVNVTDIASDAIIVSHKLIESVPLPGLSPATAPSPIQYQFRQYVSSRRGDYIDRDIGGDDSDDDDDVQPDQLTWLWVHCVKPVLDKLGIMGLVRDPNGEDGPRRVWWMGSGIASSFPFHAAGDGTEGALDSIISSYTPTIKTLGYARERSLGTTVGSNRAAVNKVSETGNESNGDDTILVVTMSTTPGRKPLAGAQRELDVIEKVVAAAGPSAADSASASTSTSLHKKFRVQRLPQPCVRDVLAQIVHSAIVHFACHGFSDSKDPSRSHLLLQRDSGGDAVSGSGSTPVVDRLTIAGLAKAVAAQPVTGSAGGTRIAFLSACSTAEVRARGLGDEGLHIASAFQMAGFVDVVGSLWSVDDDVCVALAEAFYSRLLRAKGSRMEGTGTKVGEDLGSGRRVAEALRYAVMRLRARYPESPFLWTPFVHIGA
jgi:tetratricopeptide (TPR) repeat protein